MALPTNSDGLSVQPPVEPSLSADAATPMDDSTGLPVGNPHISRHVSSYTTPRSDGSVPSSGDNDESNGREPYLGVNSMPAFIRNHSADQGMTTGVTLGSSTSVQEAIMPMLGLEEAGSTYPFLPAANKPLQNPRITFFQNLPADREVIR